MKTHSRTLETDANAPSGAVVKTAMPTENSTRVATEDPTSACFFR
jgi:hypothetical protein